MSHEPTSPPPPSPPSADASREALNELSQRLYDDLHQLAAAHLRSERAGHTLQPTALVNEAYLRLAGQHSAITDRGQFIAIASSMMRRILVDHARKRQADKRGGERTQITLAEVEHAGIDSDTPQRTVDLVALDSALQRLSVIAPDQARLVELRFFGGLNIEQTAAIMNIGKRSVDREWAIAKAWLFRELGGGGTA